MYNKTKSIIKDVLKKLNLQDYNFINTFIPPAWYTIIKTYCENKKINKKQLIFDNNVKNFLDKLWFYNWECNILKETILPIRTITTQYSDDEIEETTNDFDKLLKNYLWAWKDSLIRNIIKILWELLNNISHHSWKKDLNSDLWVLISENFQSWQYYKKNNFLQIAIVDSWVWILSSVRRVLPHIQTAEDAIKKALEPKFTWWTTLNCMWKDLSWFYNAWVWLTTSLETIKRLEGDIFIWTKDCLFSYNWKEKQEKFEKIQTWKWTFVVLNIYTKKDININFVDIRKWYLWDNSLEIKDFDNNIDFW